MTKLDNGSHVQSFARGLSVIRSFDRTHPRMTRGQLSEQTGLPRATVRRLLQTLVSMDYAETDGTSFWLTPQILELGHSYLSSSPLPDIAQRHLEELSRRTNQPSSMSILDGSDVVYVNSVPIRRIMAMSITVGTRFPASTTAMGQVLLADLADSEGSGLDDPRTSPSLSCVKTAAFDTARRAQLGLNAIQSRGWALVDHELEVGLRSIAAPVLNSDGRAVAAVNVSARAGDPAFDTIHRTILPELLRTVHNISNDLRLQSV